MPRAHWQASQNICGVGDMGKFRVRLGEAEIEYEGEDSDARYEHALEWVGGKHQPSEEKGPSHQKDIQRDKGISKKGGQRTAFIGPKIDELIKPGWFSKHRTAPEVVEELKKKAVPGVNENNVLTACKRRLGPTKLVTTIDSGERVFWTEPPKK